MANELIMEHLAQELGMAPEVLRALNLNKDGDVLHYGQVGRLGAGLAVKSAIFVLPRGVTGGL
jgi:hypothetical protein